MQSSVDSKQLDPHVAEITPDVVLVARADKENASAPDAKSGRSDPHSKAASDVSAAASAPPLDTTFRPAAIEAMQVRVDRPIAKWAMRFFVAFLLALSSGLATAAWQSHGDTAKELIAKWTPRLELALTSSVSSSSASSSSSTSSPAEDAALSEQPSAPAAPAATMATAAPQAAAPAATVEASAPAAADQPPETAQLLQSMAHDLATVARDVEQLKASIGELKGRQEQMSREIAKITEAKSFEAKSFEAKSSESKSFEARSLESRSSESKSSEPKSSEQNLRPRLAALPPRPPLPTPAHRPKPPYPAQAAMGPSSAPQTAAAPLQLQPQPQTPAEPEPEPVLRPPMPLR